MRVRRSTYVAPLALTLLWATGCGSGTSLQTTVMTMGPSFPPRPKNCTIAFVREDPTTLALKYHMIAQVMVRGDSREGMVLSGELTPKLKAILQPAACEVGADTVSPAPSMAAFGDFGAASMVGFYILKTREGVDPAPLTEPPVVNETATAL